MLVFSAPGEPTLPLLGSAHGTAFDIRQDVANTQNVVNNIQNMLKSQGRAGSQPHSVSVTRILSLTESILTVV